MHVYFFMRTLTDLSLCSFEALMYFAVLEANCEALANKKKIIHVLLVELWIMAQTLHNDQCLSRVEQCRWLQPRDEGRTMIFINVIAQEILNFIFFMGLVRIICIISKKSKESLPRPNRYLIHSRYPKRKPSRHWDKKKIALKHRTDPVISIIKH